MADHRLRLVHSSTPSDKASEQRSEWGFANARQLSLFENLDRVHVLLVPVADVSAHLFKKTLFDRAPKLIIDTRMFPDFFSIFSSTASALGEFKSRGIDYSWAPLCAPRDGLADWSHLDALKSIFISYLEKRNGAPAFILTSTRKVSANLARKLEGYLSQEVAEIRLEEIFE